MIKNALIIALLLFSGLIAGTAKASSGALVLNTAAPANGSQVSLTATYAGLPNKSHAEVAVQCSQSGAEVFVDARVAPNGGAADSPWTSIFDLSAPGWVGPADCVATLFYYVWHGNQETGVVVLGTAVFRATS